jgi:transcriptional regulator with XRE-family HTH domain
MIMTDYRKNLGKTLKQQRHSVNLTLQELSCASGVSPSHLGRIEKGERFPSASVLQRIARPLKFSEDELFTLAGYLSSDFLEAKEQEAQDNNKLDPYVASVLSREPVEVQKAVIGILAYLKDVAAIVTYAKNPANQ